MDYKTSAITLKTKPPRRKERKGIHPKLTHHPHPLNLCVLRVLRASAVTLKKQTAKTQRTQRKPRKSAHHPIQKPLRPSHPPRLCDYIKNKTAKTQRTQRYSPKASSPPSPCLPTPSAITLKNKPLRRKERKGTTQSKLTLSSTQKPLHHPRLH